MKKWHINQKPSLSECPEHYCFCWTPPKGTADLSGKVYDSFEEAVAESNNRVTFLHGGCAAPLGPCNRLTKKPEDRDSYEPFESVLRKNELPELFFCNPDNLDSDDQAQYKLMAAGIWEENA